MPKLTFKTDDLLKAFGLPTIEQMEDAGEQMVDYAYQEKDIDEVLEDYGIEDTEKNRESVRMAMIDAISMATRGKAVQQVLQTLGSVMDEFSDYKYSYDIMGEKGFEGMHGETPGIISHNIDWEKTVVEVADDFGHVINDLLSGEGTIPPDTYAEDYEAKQMQGLFHVLSMYWDVYGGRIPEVGDFDADIDKHYFKERLEEEGLLKKTKSRRQGKNRPPLDFASGRFEWDEEIREPADGPTPSKGQVGGWVKDIIRTALEDADSEIPDDWDKWVVKIGKELYSDYTYDPKMDWSYESDFELVDPDGGLHLYGDVWAQGYHEPAESGVLVVEAIGISGDL